MDLKNLTKDDLRYIIAQMKEIEKNNQDVISLLTAQSKNLTSQVAELRSEVEFFRSAMDVKKRVN